MRSILTAKRLRSPRLDDTGDIKAEAPEHAGVRAQMLSVEPDIAGVIDAVEYQFEPLARQIVRNLDVPPIPPVFLRHIRQARIASAVPEGLQLMRRFQVGLNVARYTRRNPAARRHVRQVQAFRLAIPGGILMDVPI